MKHITQAILNEIKTSDGQRRGEAFVGSKKDRRSRGSAHGKFIFRVKKKTRKIFSGGTGKSTDHRGEKRKTFKKSR